MPFRLTREQVRRVDQICVDEFGLPGIVLMENAARGAFDALERAAYTVTSGVLVVCGGGNNGGDGYALARHLHNQGGWVEIAAAKPVSELEGDAAINAGVAAKMGIPIHPATPELIASKLHPNGLLIDALLGTGLTKPPRPNAAALIQAMNAYDGRRVALDVPSGLDCDTGRPLGPAEDCVRATMTVTFVAEKVGFPHAAEWLGEVAVVGIGCPGESIDRALRA